LRIANTALTVIAFVCLAGAAAGQSGPQPLALADPLIALERGDPARRGIDLYIEAAQSGLSRGCREVVGAGALAAIVEPASLGPVLAGTAGTYDREAVRTVLRNLRARYLLVFAVHRVKTGYRVVGAALDPLFAKARLRHAGHTARPGQVLSTLRRVAERLARMAGCPHWRGKIALTRTIELQQHDKREQASDTGTETEAITYEFGFGSPKFTATLQGKLKSIRIRGGVTITREEAKSGEAAGFVHRAHAYIRVEPDGRYWFVLGAVPVKTAWQSNLCREPGKCEAARGEKTIHIAGLRLSGKAPSGGATFKGSRTIRRVGRITETLTWELVRIDR
jgi:hypothetical protein